MTGAATIDAYASLPERDTLKIQRLMPGPVERVWAYLTESDLRRKWLAAGEMQMEAGTAFTLTWRNNELTDPPGRLPPGFDGEPHSMDSRITEFELHRRLTFTWGDEGGSVTIELEPKGREVLLTLTHRRLPERDVKLMICAGWHAHLDMLAANVEKRKPDEPFWDTWSGLYAEYDKRVPA